MKKNDGVLPAARAGALPEAGFQSDRKGYLARSFLALLSLFLTVRLSINYIMPYYDPILSEARNFGQAMIIMTLVALAWIAVYAPRMLKSDIVLRGLFAMLVSGPLILFVAVRASSVSILLLGIMISYAGRNLAMVFVGVSCLGLSRRNVGFCVVSAYSISVAIEELLMFLPNVAGIVLFALLPIGSLCLSRRYIAVILDAVSTIASPAQMSITKPSSFLPFSHRFFVCIFLFKFFYGYVFALKEFHGTSFSAFAFPVALLLTALIVALRKKDFSPDSFFYIAYLSAMAGLLILLVASDGDFFGLASVFIEYGSACFEFVKWFVLITIASKNITSAIPAFAWGLAMGPAGVSTGLVLGGMSTAAIDTYSFVVSMLLGAIIFLFCAYVTILMRNFKFSDTVESLADVETPVSVASSQLIQRRSAELALEYQLTAREQEVLHLLARGHNVDSIKDSLVVSRNTVKTHVRHIYTKMDIHSQQELIDLVEGKETTHFSD